jgi:hypothetical protein
MLFDDEVEWRQASLSWTRHVSVRRHMAVDMPTTALPITTAAYAPVENSADLTMFSGLSRACAPAIAGCNGSAMETILLKPSS